MRYFEQAAAAAPQWWEIISAFAPVGTFAAAVVAAVIGLRTIRQRSYADRRAEFWRRTEWALEASVHPDPQMQTMATMVLASLAKSDLIASDEELMLLDAVWVDPIAQAEAEGLDEELGADEDRGDTGLEGPYDGPTHEGPDSGQGTTGER
ncbi:hypothetical protein [Sinomonas sp.]|jgi:hypothetical protein|uniref:hypothetical protein n=1 Tax=Sinomonas sp. TaxID=1914986 RepID=UPI002FE3E35D